MFRLCGSQRLTRRLVFSTVPFCQGEEGSQNHVCVPISACRCGQETNSVPQSKVIERRGGSNSASSQVPSSVSLLSAIR